MTIVKVEDLIGRERYEIEESEIVWTRWDSGGATPADNGVSKEQMEHYGYPKPCQDCKATDGTEHCLAWVLEKETRQARLAWINI